MKRTVESSPSLAAPLEPPPSPLLRQPGFWITLVAIIHLLIVGTYIIENGLGARELERVRKELAAAGIDLDPLHIPSIRPADAENFCVTPLLLAIGNGDVSGPEYQSLVRIARWRSHLFKRDGHLQSPSHPTPTDWSLVHDAIATEDDQSGLVKGSPAPLADLASVLDRELEPVFAELSTALPRPRSVLVPTVREKLQSGQEPTTSARSMSVVARALNLRARTDLATGREARAATTIRIMLKLAEGAEADNFFLNRYAGNHIRLDSLETTWIAALLPQGTPAQEWLELSAAYRTTDGLDRLRDFFQCEMILSNLYTTELRQDSTQLGAAIDWYLHPGRTFFSPDPTSRSHWKELLVDLIPEGWVDINLARSLEGNLKLLERVSDRKQKQRFNIYANSDWSKDWLSSKSAMGHGLFARSSLGMFGSLVAGLARHVVLCRLAQSACALEAYHGRHGAYPPILLALVPNYLPAVPTDLDGQPVRYALEPANGRYSLWSVGADDLDDGGMEKPDPAGMPGRSPRPWHEPVGDWVWRYPK